MLHQNSGAWGEYFATQFWWETVWIWKLPALALSTTVADWDSIDRVVTQTRNRAF